MSVQCHQALLPVINKRSLSFFLGIVHSPLSVVFPLKFYENGVLLFAVDLLSTANNAREHVLSSCFSFPNYA